MKVLLISAMVVLVLTIAFFVFLCARMAKALRREAKPAPAPTVRFEGSAGCDLMGASRPVFVVKLPPDGQILHLTTPTKAMSDRFAEIGGVLDRLGKGKGADGDEDALFRLAADLLGDNLDRISMMPMALRRRCSTADIVKLLADYMGWLKGVIDAKN